MRYCMQGLSHLGPWEPQGTAEISSGSEAPRPTLPTLLIDALPHLLSPWEHTHSGVCLPTDSLLPRSQDRPRCTGLCPDPTRARPRLAHQAGRDTQSYSGNSRRSSRPASCTFGLPLQRLSRPLPHPRAPGPGPGRTRPRGCPSNYRTTAAPTSAAPWGRAPPAPAAEASARDPASLRPDTSSGVHAPAPSQRSPKGEYAPRAPLSRPGPGFCSGRSPARPAHPGSGRVAPENPARDPPRPARSLRGPYNLLPPRFAPPRARAGLTCPAR